MDTGTRRNMQGIRRSELPSAPKEECLVDILDACEERGETPSLELLHKVGLGDADCQVLSKLERNNDSAVAEAVDDFCTRLQAIASPGYKSNTDFYNSLSRVMERELALRKKGISQWNAAVAVFPWNILKFSSRTACKQVYSRIYCELGSTEEGLKREIGEDGVQRDRYLQEVLGKYILEKRNTLDFKDMPLSAFSLTVKEKVKEAIFPTAEELKGTKEYTQLSYDVASLLSECSERTD